MGHRALLVLALWLAGANTAHACADPPSVSFRQMLGTASSVFVFQLVEAHYVREDLGGGTSTERIEGRINVVDTLKGHGDAFRQIRYAFRSCGSVRMSVGQFYLAATTQKGPVLEVWDNDQALLDLSLDFYSDKTGKSPAVDTLRGILNGLPMPADFPRDELVDPLRVYPLPPPPPKSTKSTNSQPT